MAAAHLSWAAAATAALVDQGMITLDTDTGLGWLDVSESLDLSPSAALTQNPGYRFARRCEVETLLANAGFTQVAIDPPTALPLLVSEAAAATLLTGLIGTTSTPSPVSITLVEFINDLDRFDMLTITVLDGNPSSASAVISQNGSAGGATTPAAYLLVHDPNPLTLTLEPPSVLAEPEGSDFSVDLVLSGLPADTCGHSIGAFDIDVTIDSAAVTLQGTSFGASLGNLAATNPAELQAASSGSGSPVSLAAASQLSAASLSDLQTASSIVLGSLTLSAVSQGSATLSVTREVIGADDGKPLTVEQVTESVITVPEPGGFISAVVCLLALLAGGRRRG